MDPKSHICPLLVDEPHSRGSLACRPRCPHQMSVAWATEMAAEVAMAAGVAMAVATAAVEAAGARVTEAAAVMAMVIAEEA